MSFLFGIDVLKRRFPTIFEDHKLPGADIDYREWYHLLMKGIYIVIEGIIGTGKSSNSKALSDYLKEKYPQKEIVYTREPGGTEIAEAIRCLVQGTEFKEEMDPICEAYLYAASRAQSLQKIVKPVLDAGGIVISDRNFITSLTNQAFGRELGFEKVFEINKQAIEGFYPDLVIQLELDIETALSRTFDHKADKFERLPKEFYERVVEGYKFLQNHEMFKDRWKVIDASASMDLCFEQTKDVVNEFLSSRL